MNITIARLADQPTEQQIVSTVGLVGFYWHAFCTVDTRDKGYGYVAYLDGAFIGRGTADYKSVLKRLFELQRIVTAEMNQE